MTKALALALLVACTPAQRTAALAVSSSALIVVDWHQTARITSECRELNPVIGLCGEHMPPNVYFPTILVLNAAVGLALGTWRDTWFAAVTGAQASTTWLNWRNGK